MADTLPRLLAIEDDPGLQKQLRWSFQGYEVIVAGERRSAMDYMRTHHPAVVTLDLGLPPDADGVSEGLATLNELLQFDPYAKVIVVTGRDEREHAVKAIGEGAYDFYVKPIDVEELGLVINRAYRVYELERENRELSRKQVSTPLPGIIATSYNMLKVCRDIEKVAPTDASVLIGGESGTGKELLARALHRLSERADERFVAINCAAIPETLLESELFGYEKGAFTGAARQTIGKIERAQHGTLFLDEIGDLSLSLQAKLLRFLQEKTIERLGGHDEVEVDVRVVAATHQDLKKLMEEGGFREDLYYRLAQIVIDVPPLSQRPGDAAAIAKELFRNITGELGKRSMKLSAGALQVIESYSWPGNVRELENRLRQVVIMNENKDVLPEDLGLPLGPDDPPCHPLASYREEAERRALEQALGVHGGNVSRAAKMLQISRPTLYDLMNKYNYRC
jgi:two-component system NtrC family response regulator